MPACTGADTPRAGIPACTGADTPRAGIPARTGADTPPPPQRTVRILLDCFLVKLTVNPSYNTGIIAQVLPCRSAAQVHFNNTCVTQTFPASKDLSVIFCSNNHNLFFSHEKL